MDDIADDQILIENLTTYMERACVELKHMAEGIEIFIKNGWKGPLPQIIEAFTLTLMDPEKVMVPLEGANLIYQMLGEIPNDFGVQVNRDYMIRKLPNSAGSLDSMHEDYKVSYTERPIYLIMGAPELQSAEVQMESLLSSFQIEISAETWKQVKATFNAYMGI